MKYTKRSVLIFTALLLATLSSLHAELGLDREAYGVWDREGGHAVAQYPFTRGQAYYELWANVNSARSNFNWAALDAGLQFAEDQNQKFNIQISPIGGSFGSSVPPWMSEANGGGVPFFTEIPNVSGYTYGYYLNTNFQTYFREMVQALAHHVRQEVASNLQARIAFVRVDTGATGDEEPYENPGNITNVYRISANDWRTYRLWAFELYRQAFQVGPGPVIPLLFQDIEKTGFPTEWSWVTNNVLGGFGAKYGGLVRGHHMSKSREVTDSYREYSVDSNFKMFSRNEMDQTWTKPFFQLNIRMNMYWCAVEQLYPGQSIWDVSGSCLENTYIDNYTFAFEFFNKWSAELDPATAGGGFCILHEGLDSADTSKFPTGTYGSPANQGNTNRYAAICAAYASQGARMDHLEAATWGQVVQRRDQTNFNDAGWQIVPGNYERFITQLNPAATSKGVWRIVGATNGGVLTTNSHPYDRFARRFDHASGRDAMYFNINTNLLPSPGQRVQLSVIYRNSGTGQFALLYDALTNSQKTAFTVTKTNSNEWRTNSQIVTDWVFGNNGPSGADLVLTNLDAEDDIFHSVELIKLADVNVGTVGKGTVSGRTDATVYAPIMGTFMERQRLELTVTPAAGWVFTGWSGELSGTNTRPFLFPTKDSRVTAHFAVISGTNASSVDDFNSGTFTNGTGWSGGWSTSGTATSGATVELNSNGQITRTLATALTNATLSFAWDLDRIGGSDSGAVAVFNGSWQTVWSETEKGLDSGSTAELVTTNINLSAYGSISHIRFTLNGADTTDRFWIDDVSVTGTPSVTVTNTQPLFSSDPIGETPATNGVAYVGTLADNASDPNSNPLTFSKLSGPGWLSVATNGVLSGNPTNAIVGLNSWLVRITNGVGGSDDAILLINVGAAVAPSNSAYTVWANQYQLVQGPSGNDDGDRLSNLYEFGLGGNPTNATGLGYPITYRLNSAGGTNWLEYVHPKRGDPNSGLLYYLELATNLVSPAWTNTGYTVVGSGPLTNGFLSVTNRIETDLTSRQFIRLVVEKP